MDFIHDRKVFYAAVLPCCAGILGFLITFAGWFAYDTAKMHFDYQHAVSEHEVRHVSAQNLINVLSKAIAEEQNNERKTMLTLEKDKFIATMTPVNSVKSKRYFEELSLRDDIVQLIWVIFIVVFAFTSTSFLWCLNRLRGKRGGGNEALVQSPPYASDLPSITRHGKKMQRRHVHQLIVPRRPARMRNV